MVSRAVAAHNRLRVLEAVARRPGSAVSELARDLSLSWTSVALHVAALERAGRVRVVRAGRVRIVFLAGAPRDPRAAALLAEPACRRLAHAIVAHPDRRVWELCEIAGMSERAVYHHVRRLVAAGLLVGDPPGTYRSLRATPDLVEHLG